MMVRFSCFNAHIHSSKPKKTMQLSAEAMHKSVEDRSDNQGLKKVNNSSGASLLRLKTQEDKTCTTADQVTSSSLVEPDWKSEEIKIKYDPESDVMVNKTNMKKSRSLGSGLDRKGSVSGGNDSEDETDQGFSGDGSHYQVASITVGDNDPEISPSDQCPETLHSVSLQVSSNMVNNDSIFSIGDPQQFEQIDGRENSDTQFFGECAGESSNHTLRTPHVLVNSRSLPDIFYGGHSNTVTIRPRARSCEDLNVLDLKLKEMSVLNAGPQVIRDEERDDSVKNYEKVNTENLADEGYDGYNCVGSAKDWIIPVMEEVNTVANPEAESTVRHWEKLPVKDFKIRRIEDWVIDLQHCSPLEEKYEIYTSSDQQADGGVNVLDGLISARQEVKITPGMEGVKRYISTLSATATSAQLANHGLVVIPFLSAFVSLKALNLSGNAIVRITAGALPRGLHFLNLSKNNISTIEGLRELTRLRVLDLSYNRILRIGHGLASCCSLKELYLAGNKISEVEGLHRLLKLNVLDLRFNKITTTKCLGQLAANYSSLQAISLEGNPAQKNVGDEQVKKYLQGLLPHLAYFNRQSIKAGTLKDSADRSARLGISAHQFDRSLRSDIKTMRKANHGVVAHSQGRPSSSSSSIHGHRSQQAGAAPKPSRDRHGWLPPSGIKTTTARHSFYDFGSKLLSFRPDLAMHRSRSEGTLGGL